jgi:hypothetical protein
MICFSLVGLFHFVIFSRLIHVVINDSISLFSKTESYSIVYLYHIFFIHSSIDELIGWLPWLLWIILQWRWECSISLNTDLISFCDIPVVGFMDHRVLYLTLWATSIMVSIMVVLILLFTNITEEFPFFHILTNSFLFFSHYLIVIGDTLWLLQNIF